MKMILYDTKILILGVDKSFMFADGPNLILGDGDEVGLCDKEKLSR